MDKIIAWLSSAYEKAQNWVLDLVLWIPRKIYSSWADDIASYVESISPPDSIQQFTYYVGQWVDQAGYWFDLLQVNWGLAAITTAIMFRWSKKFVPFFGGF